MPPFLDLEHVSASSAKGCKPPQKLQLRGFQRMLKAGLTEI